VMSVSGAGAGMAIAMADEAMRAVAMVENCMVVIYLW
jgi:hypothetical protein